DEITIPDWSLFPPAPLGGARTEPTSPGPPSPYPFLPEPERPSLEPTEGGGGITLSARSVPLPDPPEFLEPVGDPCSEPPRSEPVTDGGGGITFCPPSDAP